MKERRIWCTFQILTSFTHCLPIHYNCTNGSLDHVNKMFIYKRGVVSPFRIQVKPHAKGRLVFVDCTDIEGTSQCPCSQAKRMIILDLHWGRRASVARNTDKCRWVNAQFRYIIRDHLNPVSHTYLWFLVYRAHIYSNVILLTVWPSRKSILYDFLGGSIPPLEHSQL